MKKILFVSALLVSGFVLGGCNDEPATTTTTSTTTTAASTAPTATGICQEYFDLVKKCTSSIDKTYADQYAQNMKTVEQQIASMPKEQADQICKMSFDASKVAFANMGCK